MFVPWTYLNLNRVKLYSFYDDSIYNQIFEKVTLS